MLTEKEKEWLERRKVLCTHCDLIARGLCQVHNKTSCSHWDRFHCNNPVKRYKAFQDMQDAAEFEARVAIKLAKSICFVCPDNKGGGCNTKSRAQNRACIEVCRLRHARIALEIPAGYFAAIFPRSSIFFTGLELTNCVGVIDSDFRAPISAIFREVPGDQGARRRALHPLFPGKTHMMCPYKPGDRIAQLIIQPCVVPVMGRVTLSEMGSIQPYCDLEKVEFVEVDELSTTERGSNGYGSTGR